MRENEFRDRLREALGEPPPLPAPQLTPSDAGVSRGYPRGMALLAVGLAVVLVLALVAAVVLKATFDPRWQVIVDGKRAMPYMVVPGFVAVTVGPGRHVVVFQYVAYSHYPLLLGIGGVTLLMLALGPWLWRTRGRRAFERLAGERRWRKT